MNDDDDNDVSNLHSIDFHWYVQKKRASRRPKRKAEVGVATKKGEIERYAVPGEQRAHARAKNQRERAIESGLLDLL